MLEHLEARERYGDETDARRLAPRAGSEITLASRLAVWEGRLESDEPVEVYVTGSGPPRPCAAPAEFSFDVVVTNDAWQTGRTRDSGVNSRILAGLAVADGRQPRFEVPRILSRGFRAPSRGLELMSIGLDEVQRGEGWRWLTVSAAGTV